MRGGSFGNCATVGGKGADMADMDKVDEYGAISLYMACEKVEVEKRVELNVMYLLLEKVVDMDKVKYSVTEWRI